MIWLPHQYQLDKVNDLLNHRNWALFLDPGMGKTSIVLRALQEVKKAGYRKTIVVAPLWVATTSWPDEIRKWSNFHNLRAEVWHGYNPIGIRTTPADIVLVNFDYIMKMCKLCMPEKFAEFYGFDGLVIDELTAYKSIKSKRSQAMKKISAGMKFRWGLTGTPTANRLMDIFGQALVLDGGATFGKWITHFRNQYFRPTGYGGYKYELQSDAARDAIYAGIAKLGSRLAAEDYLQMPELIENRIQVDMPETVLKSYKEVERDLVTVLYDECVSVPNKAAALNKCRQFAGGSVYNNNQIMQVHSAKADALETLFDEMNGQQLLVFVGFRSEAEYLKRRFDFAHVIMGGTGMRAGTEAIKSWNDGTARMLIAHPASISHGINLQHGGNHICWYTLTWDYEQYDQSNRRLFRQGQRNNVVMHKILTNNTVDGYVNKVLSSKRNEQNGLFDYLKQEMTHGPC